MHLFTRSKTEDQTTGRRTLRNRLRDAEQNRTFSYYASRSASETNVGREPSAASERTAPQHGRFDKFVRRALFLLVGLGVLWLAVSGLELGTTPNVVPLSSPSGRVFLRPTGTYQRAAMALFRSSLANRNKLTVNVNSISTSLKREFPELSAVTVTLPAIGHQPIVYIQPFEPSMVLITQNSGSFVLNASGEALLPAETVASQLARQKVPIVTSQSGLRVATGQVVLPSTTVQFIQTIAAQLRAQAIGITSMTLPRAASEVDVYIAGEPFYVKFNTQNDTALQQVGTFIAVFKQLKAQGITPREYFDVRIDGRAYYK